MAVKKKVTAMDRVKLARDPKRPHLMDFLILTRRRKWQ